MTANGRVHGSVVRFYEHWSRSSGQSVVTARVSLDGSTFTGYFCEGNYGAVGSIHGTRLVSHDAGGNGMLQGAAGVSPRQVLAQLLVDAANMVGRLTGTLVATNDGDSSIVEATTQPGDNTEANEVAQVPRAGSTTDPLWDVTLAGYAQLTGATAAASGSSTLFGIMAGGSGATGGAGAGAGAAAAAATPPSAGAGESASDQKVEPELRESKESEAGGSQDASELGGVDAMAADWCQRRLLRGGFRAAVALPVLERAMRRLWGRQRAAGQPHPPLATIMEAFGVSSTAALEVDNSSTAIALLEQLVSGSGTGAQLHAAMDAQVRPPMLLRSKAMRRARRYLAAACVWHMQASAAAQAFVSQGCSGDAPAALVAAYTMATHTLNRLRSRLASAPLAGKALNSAVASTAKRKARFLLRVAPAQAHGFATGGDAVGAFEEELAQFVGADIDIAAVERRMHTANIKAALRAVALALLGRLLKDYRCDTDVACMAEEALVRWLRPALTGQQPGTVDSVHNADAAARKQAQALAFADPSQG